MLKFKHSGKCGDVIASLPTIAALAKGQPARLLLKTDVCDGTTTLLTRATASSLLPLLAKCPFLDAVGVWDGEEVDVDLDDFRRTGFNLMAGNLPRYYCHAFPVCPNTWEPWLAVDPDPAFTGCILVNRSLRYHNRHLSYAFMSRWLPRLQFIGLPEEYRAFRASSGLNIPHARTGDFLDAARAIVGASLFVGNQSACFWVAEALKVPRILEVCPHVPNVMPCGPGGYEAFTQEIFEMIVNDKSQP